MKENCNIQDRVIIHALENSSCIIEENTSLAHGCIVHGPCKIGKNCFVGFGSVVFGTGLGNGVMVKHLAIVEKAVIPCQRLIPNGAVIDSQDKAKQLKKVSAELKEFCRKVIKMNLKLLNGYKKLE